MTRDVFVRNNVGRCCRILGRVAVAGRQAGGEGGGRPRAAHETRERAERHAAPISGPALSPGAVPPPGNGPRQHTGRAARLPGSALACRATGHTAGIIAALYLPVVGWKGGVMKHFLLRGGIHFNSQCLQLTLENQPGNAIRYSIFKFEALPKGVDGSGNIFTKLHLFLRCEFKQVMNISWSRGQGWLLATTTETCFCGRGSNYGHNWAYSIF